VPDLADPRNLYALLAAHARAAEPAAATS